MSRNLTLNRSVRQFAVTRRKLASEQGVVVFASSPSTYIWRTANGAHTPPSPAERKVSQFADDTQATGSVGDR